MDVRLRAAQAVGELSDRELFIAGVAPYWAEGAKDKPHRRTEALQFINSDATVISETCRGCLVIYIPAERRPIPSHRGCLVRHSRRCRSAT
ncbi:hypothetical protein AQJ23_31520 [Streptomyces antibioticus]|nr:hypothetical protein AQJ23_31520 [Streptomyces antibioticus]